MTLDERLRLIDELYSRATKGPWNVSWDGSTYDIVGELWRVAIMYGGDSAKGDADFICALHEAWPEISARLRGGWIAERFVAEALAKSCKNIPPEFSQVVDREFWNLLRDPAPPEGEGG